MDVQCYVYSTLDRFLLKYNIHLKAELVDMEQSQKNSTRNNLPHLVSVSFHIWGSSKNTDKH